MAFKIAGIWIELCIVVSLISLGYIQAPKEVYYVIISSQLQWSRFLKWLSDYSTTYSKFQYSGHFIFKAHYKAKSYNLYLFILFSP